MTLDANAKDIIKKVKELFFPRGKSFHGDALDMTFELGRFNCNTIRDTQFSLGKYIEENKLTRVRLYLLSKCDKESRGEELPIAPFSMGEAATNGPDHNVNMCTTSGIASNTSDGIVGTSHERDLLKQQQEEELNMSLLNDQRKYRIKAEEQEALNRQRHLQMARKSKVPDIPGSSRYTPCPCVHTSSNCWYSDSIILSVGEHVCCI